MAETIRFRRPTVGGWLRPLLAGAALGAYGSVLIHALVQGGWWSRLITFGWGWLVTSAWLAVYLILLVATDLALLSARLRTLPVGGRAWAMAIGSTSLLYAAFALLHPISRYFTAGPWVILAAFLAPMIVIAPAMRIVFGRRP